MNVELSKFEVELLDRALEAWEGQASHNSGVRSMAVKASECADLPDVFREAIVKAAEESQREALKRRTQSVLLRSKLLQALAVDSEHSVEPDPITPPPGGK